MELVFEEQSIDYLRRIFSGSAAQELTQELIVPDSYPDCGRIVFTGACAVMRGKENLVSVQSVELSQSVIDVPAHSAMLGKLVVKTP